MQGFLLDLTGVTVDPLSLTILVILEDGTIGIVF